MEFTVQEIIKITKGTLIQGDIKQCVSRISIDSRTIKPKELFVAIKGTKFDGHNFVTSAIEKTAGGVIISRDLNLSYPKDFVVIRVEDTTIALGDIARAHRQKFNIPVVAITGSNGKTTTKEMVSRLLKCKYNVLGTVGTQNNQIGIPLTLLRLDNKYEIVVLELGSNHPGEIAYLAKIALPTVAIITNIGLSHLEFFNNPEAVFKEKFSLIKNLGSNGIAILNKDDKYLNRIKISPKSKFKKNITFSLNSKSDFKVSRLIVKQELLEFQVNHKFWLELKSLARHNVYNALAAISCARYFGINFLSIRKALKNFCFPAGRMQLSKLKRFTIIDDTYNSNPNSMQIALEALSQYDSINRKVLVCADMLELGRFSNKLHLKIGKTIASSKVDILITVGNLSKWIASGATKAGMESNRILSFDSKEVLKQEISHIIRPSDVILIKGSRLMAMEEIVSHIQKIDKN